MTTVFPKVGRWWTFLVSVVVPIEALVLLGWWLWEAKGWDPEWLHPFQSANVGTVLFQFAIALTALVLANRWLALKGGRASESEGVSG